MTYVRKWERPDAGHYILRGTEFEVEHVSLDHWNYDPALSWQVFGADGVVISRHKTKDIAKRSAEKAARAARRKA